MVNLSPFSETVIKTILKIPHGKVATYKQIAELSGKPHAARAVSWILHSSSTKYKLPWHRVLGSSGKISFEKNTHNFRKQRSLLQREGIEVHETGELDLKLYQWKKKVKTKAPRAKGPQLFR